MDDEDSNFEEIFIKNEPSSPISDFELIGNVEKLSQPPPEKRLKITDPLDVSSNDPSKTVGDDSALHDMVFSKRLKKKHVDMDPFEREIVKILEANRSQLDYSVRDPDAMFFISHVPVLKQFNPRVKLDFQLKFMQLLQSYSLPSVRAAMGNLTAKAPSECSNVDDISNDCVLETIINADANE